MVEKDYISLHTLSTFSIGLSLLKPSELFKKVKELGQSGVGITDNCMGSAWDSLKYSKEAGVKLIMGYTANFVDDVQNCDNVRLRNVVLLAKNHTGYKNLLKLNRIGYDYGVTAFKRFIPRIDWKLLEEHSEGLICLTGDAGGILGNLINTRRLPEAKKQAARLKELFGDSLGFEIQPHNMFRKATSFHDDEDQNLVNRALISLGEQMGVRVVATNHACYATKEEWDSWDTYMCITTGKLKKEVARLKYPNEFYLKTRDEIVGFFARSFGARAEEFCDNSLYFAGLCENPEWIDPRPEGKGWELPEFPVKDQPDYEEFRKEYEVNPELNSRPEDAAYVRYLCEKELIKQFSDKYDEYKKRLEMELEVFEMKNLSGYLLIVKDFLEWARSNGIPTGEGRGCCVGETKVLTENGYKKIEEIDVGEKVYTRYGRLNQVIKKFEYPLVSEKLIEIKSERSFETMLFTSDHEFLVKHKNNEHLEWIKAKDLSNDHRMFTPCISREDIKADIETIDLNQFVPTTDRNHIRSISDEFIEIKFHSRNELAVRSICRATGADFEITRKAKLGKLTKDNAKTDKQKKHLSTIENYLSNYQLDLDSWKNTENFDVRKIKRSISLDESLLYLIGRWIGDGCFHAKTKGITIAFNKSDHNGIEKVTNYFEDLGFYVSYNPSSSCNGVNLTVSNKIIFNLFKWFVPDYAHTSNTKHLPNWFRKLSEFQLKSLLQGIIDSDGHYREDGSYTIKTVSERLCGELRELLLFLKVSSGIYVEKAGTRSGRNCKKSYALNFRFNNKQTEKYENQNELGLLAKVVSTREIEVEGSKVYDIEVENEHCYLTQNGIAHNSVGGSLTAYLLKIHNADPLKYGLIFERFYNKEKNSASDVDNDLSKAGKPLVEEYIYNKYGQRYCAQISNFATLTPKPYARAIARAYMYGGDRKASVAVGNAIADSIPKDKDLHSVSDALEKAPLFSEYAKTEKYKDLGLHAKSIGNQIYNLSTHAAGVVIGSRPLDEIVPVRKSKEGVVALEYEKERAEENGLVKMDILGLSTLDIVQDTLRIIQSRNKVLPQIPWNYDANDEKAYELIGKGSNFGVFQLGTSAGTIDLCRQLKPKNIIDLAIINALARPGFPKEVRGDFIEIKLGKKKAKAFHPVLENAFKETFGFLLFEETLLKVANDVAGWSMSEADRLRKLVKEKGRYPAKEAKLRQDFIASSVKNRNLSENDASKIWDDVVGKAGNYMFNKSHAVLYSMLSYQTAYLKAHYPLEFLIANLNYEVQSNAQDSEKNILQIKNEIRGLGVKIISPNLNRSGMSYQIVDDNAVMCGLDALKYMGKDAIPEILAKRPFTSFEDFLSRTNGRLVRAPAIQALAAAGCLDEFGLTRKQMYLYSGDYKKKLAVWQKRKGKNEPFHYPWPDVGEFTVPELHALEIYYLGEGLTGTAKEVYPNFFSRKVANIAELMKKYPASKDKETIELQPNDGSIEGIVTDYYEFKVKKEDSKYFGQEMARITMQDLDGNTFSCVVFPDRLGEVKKRMKALCGSKLKKIEPGCAIGVFGNLNWYQGELSIICDGLKKIAPPPQLPEDRKPKQIKMKITGTTKKKKKGEQLEMFSEPEDILNEIEDELVEEGLNNPEEAEDDWGIFDDAEEENYREENGEIFEDNGSDSEDAFN